MIHILCIILLNRSGSFSKAILERMGGVLHPWLEEPFIAQYASQVKVVYLPGTSTMNSAQDQPHTEKMLRFEERDQVHSLG